MNVLNRARQHWMLCAVLVTAALARLLYLFDYHEILWDSGVYLGMAKYLWSAGASGLWEHIRPVLWPAVLGAAWWLKLNIVLFARILEFLTALVSIVLVYALGRKWFSQRAAVFASVVWAFSAIAFHLSFHEYTELPAVALALGALLAFSSSRWFLAGLLASLAFLIKFPAGIFIVVLGLAMLAQRRWKQLVPLCLGFAIPTAAYLLFNQVMYGTALGPLIEARQSILSVLGCNVLRFKPWWQYFAWIIADNWLNVAAIVSIGTVVFRWKRQYLLPALAFAIPAVYLMQLHCREYRYLVLFLPFLVLFTGHGLDIATAFLERLKPLRKNIAAIILVAVFAISAFHGILFYLGNEQLTPKLAEEEYVHWLEGRQIEGEIWSSNPVVSAYTDQPIRKIYYPLYDEGTAADFNEYLAQNGQRIGAVLLDNCGGGIICAPGDTGCSEQLQKTRSFLAEKFTRSLFTQSGNCWYEIYTSA